MMKYEDIHLKLIILVISESLQRSQRPRYRPVHVCLSVYRIAFIILRFFSETFIYYGNPQILIEVMTSWLSVGCLMFTIKYGVYKYK
jgi:hypothetical protein